MYSYLTEKSLGSILKGLFPNAEVKPQVQFKYDVLDHISEKNKSCKFIVDYVINKGNGENLILVEYNGPTHYRERATQIRDVNLFCFCKENNFSLVEIPYFIQPDCFLFEYLFQQDFSSFKDSNEVKGFSKEFKDSFQKEIDWNFPQGFISAKCLRPVDFNVFGWNLFVNFLSSLKNSKEEIKLIGQEILNSLRNEKGNFPSIWMNEGWNSISILSNCK